MSEAAPDLVRKAKKGDGEAFAGLTRPFHQRLFETAFFLSGDRDEAEDLVQECLIKAYLSIRRFREDAPLLPWLLKILRNRFLDTRRSGRNRHVVRMSDREEDGAICEADEDLMAEWGRETDALEKLLSSERKEELRRLIAGLPPNFALVLVLVDIQGFSYAEASRVIEVPVNTVRTRLFRARTLLRRMILSGMGNF